MYANFVNNQAYTVPTPTYVNSIDMATVSSNTLQISDSEGLMAVSPSGAASTLNLPALATGWNAKVVLAATGAAVTFKAPSAVVYGAIASGVTGGSGLLHALANGSTNVVSSGTECQIGDWVKFVCDGTNYYVEGFSSANGAPSWSVS